MKFSRRSLERLKGVHPKLIVLATAVLERYPHYDLSIIEGVRSYERQLQLVDEGFSKTLKSKHLKQDDGFAHAIDMKPSTLPWDAPEKEWKRFAEDVMVLVKELDLNVISGGLAWSWDYPHFQLINEET